MNYIALILFNILFFICNLYPKHIVEIGSVLSVVAIVLNILFYIAFFWFLSVAFRRNKTLFSKDIFSPLETFFEKLCIKPIAILMAVQVLFDILYIALSQTIDQYSICCADVFTLAQWIVIYCIFTRKQKNIFNKKKSIIITAAVLTVLLTTSMVGNFEINKMLVECGNKYAFDVSLLLIATKNLDFIFQVKNMLLDTLIGFVLLVSHSISVSEKVKKEDIKFTKAIIRFCVCVFVAIFAFLFKTLIMPYNSLTVYNIKKDNATVYTDKNNFYANTKIRIIKRNKDVVFQITENEIYYNKTLLKKFTTVDGKSARTMKFEGNQMTVVDCFEDKTIDGNDVKVYKDIAICFMHDGKPIVLLCDTYGDLNFHEYELVVGD